jgi:hypothetical protein
MRQNPATRDFRRRVHFAAPIVNLVLIVLFSATGRNFAVAQGVAADVTAGQPYTNQYQTEFFTNDLKEVFHLKHIEGDGQGDVPAYTNFGFTKFAWRSDGVLMFDFSGRVTDDAMGGFSAGIHRRLIAGDYILGAGMFGDVQQDYSQLSPAFEVFSENYSFRANGYFVLNNDPETKIEYDTTAQTNIFFQGNNVLADNLLLEEEHTVPLSGADIEFARHFINHASEVFVGGYFLGGDFGQDAIGAKAGVRGFFTRDVAASLSVAHDDLFGTNVYGGLTWFVGARGGLSRPNMARRLIVPVERNEQVAVAESKDVTPIAGPIVLTHEDDAIEIVHVDAAAAAGGDGTFENPYNVLPPTEDADIVYVHANGVFVGQSYTVAEDQRLLGEGSGVVHHVDTDQLDEIVLPAGNGGANRPIIQAALGNAIVLGGGDSEVSNMEIQGAGVTVNGIFADGVDGFDINRNVIANTVGNGIFLNNVRGEVGETQVATGEVTDNIVTGSTLQNIRIVLDSNFEGEITGNTANTSVTSNGIDISNTVNGPFVFRGEIEDNIANNNAVNGISVAVDEFHGDISENTANTNGANGMLLTFETFRGDVEENTTNGNGASGIEFDITGNFFSRAEITNNTANNNAAEGMHLLFSGTGTSAISVLDNNFSGNNGGEREFFAENEDAYGNHQVVFIELDGNISTNAPAAGFNYEFDNFDALADGEMTLDLGTNIGTVELDEEVELGEFPFD